MEKSSGKIACDYYFESPNILSTTSVALSTYLDTVITADAKCLHFSMHESDIDRLICIYRCMDRHYIGEELLCQGACEEGNTQEACG